jgi:hypothetical protein
MDNAVFRARVDSRIPRSKAASTSKSCRCSHVGAPHSRPVIHARGAAIRAGATARTTSGRQPAWPSITGLLLPTKLARCSKRLRPVTSLGTQRGHLSTIAPWWASRA